jgi:hypothetical protein
MTLGTESDSGDATRDAGRAKEKCLDWREEGGGSGRYLFRKGRERKYIGLWESLRC